VKNLVVESDGAHKGQLDLKRRGLGPVIGIGRWLAICTASPVGPTQERLVTGAEAGLLTTDEFEQLRHAHQEMYELLFEAEIEALSNGARPSTYVDPDALDTLTRRHLRESFKAIARVQERLEHEWLSGLR
jgi:CBS domain-containing protein